MQAIGIDLGGTNIKSALVDYHKGIVKQFSIPTEAEKGVDHIFNQLGKVIEEAAGYASDDVVGVGVGSPGVISLDRKSVSYPPNFPGWEVEPFTDRIYELTGMASRVENDANLAALGSSRYGVGQSFDSMIMLTLGTGVGGGIIFNRELYRGSTGAAAELGHVIIDYNGPSSNSNAKGGIEAYLGQKFLCRNAVEKIRQYPDNPLYLNFRDDFTRLEPLDIYLEAKQQNELAIEILSEAGRMLGYAIVNYIHILDITNIVVGGGVARAGDYILEPARKAAWERLLPGFRENYNITYEKLGNDAALLGAASLAFETFGEQ